MNHLPRSDTIPPTPDHFRDDALADARWLLGRFDSGEIQDHRGRYVAVAGKQVLAGGDDPLRLRQDTAKSHGVDPRRLVITYIDNPDTVWSEGSW
jgi:hypothetical protein